MFFRFSAAWCSFGRRTSSCVVWMRARSPETRRWPLTEAILSASLRLATPRPGRPLRGEDDVGAGALGMETPLLHCMATQHATSSINHSVSVCVACPCTRRAHLLYALRTRITCAFPFAATSRCTVHCSASCWRAVKNDRRRLRECSGPPLRLHIHLLLLVSALDQPRSSNPALGVILATPSESSHR